MTDRAAIIADLKTKEPTRWRWTPQGNEEYTPEEYEASIQESADFLVAQAARETTEASERTVRDQVRAALLVLDADYATLETDHADLLNAGLAMSVATLRTYLARMNRIVARGNRTQRGLIRILIARGLIEPEGS